MPLPLAMRRITRNAKTRTKPNCVIGTSQLQHHQNRGYQQEQAQQAHDTLQSKGYSHIPIQHTSTTFRFHRLRVPHYLHRRRNFYPATHPQTSRLTPASVTARAAIQTRAMASDASYLSFLEKANQDPSAGTSQATQSKAEGGFVSTKTLDQNANEVPHALKSVDVDYVSDTDEPFEAVVLMWEGAAKGEWPSIDQFRSLISTSESSSSLAQADISTLSLSSFDPKNQYASVLKAVREAAPGTDGSDAEVRVYRLEIGSTRAEYWVLALDGKGGRILGLKARAVES